MNIDNLKELLSSGVQPVIEINDYQVKVGDKTYENGAVEYGDMSPGMRGRLVDIKKDDPYGDGVSEVIVDMTEFYEHNCVVDEGNHYGDRGMGDIRLYKWHELPSYPKDHRNNFYVTDDEIIEFRLLDGEVSDLYRKYKEENTSQSYLTWLEAIILSGLQDVKKVE